MSDTNVEFADPTLSAYTRGVAKRIANPDAIEKRVGEDAWFIVLFHDPDGRDHGRGYSSYVIYL